MDIDCLLETVKQIWRNLFSDVSTETLNAATFWINYITSRTCIQVDAMLVSVTMQYAKTGYFLW